MINFAHIRSRRNILASLFAELPAESWLEESCLPSYCHANLAAAYTAWWRLFSAAALMRRLAPQGPVLDFGAGAGELRHLLPSNISYDFIEQTDQISDILRASIPNARRRRLEALPSEHYACVFALDSLEHNVNYCEILDILGRSLHTDGILIISGPTENFLYKIGRRLAGFDGHYHVTNIYDINTAAAKRLHPLSSITGPTFLPLFVLSAWRRRTI